MKYLFAFFLLVLAVGVNAEITSETRMNAFGNGYDTTYSDGTTSETRMNAFGNGYETTYSDGSRAETRVNAFGNGYDTTYYDN